MKTKQATGPGSSGEAIARRFQLQIILLVMLLLLLSPALGQRVAPTEYQVKAAYLFNFAKFVRWRNTTNARSEFPICVLGRDPFGPDLDNTMSGELIDGKRVIAARIEAPKAATQCKIVFISASEEPHLSRMLAELPKQGVLTVSDISGFVDRGGMIQFQAQENRIRFEINLAAAERAGLALSSDLLKVATKVRRAGN
jgi:uncharacterized protein DUF4154